MARTLPLDAVNEGFGLMHADDSIRSVPLF